MKMTNDDLLSTPFTTPEWELYPPAYPDLLGLVHKIVVSDYNSSTPFSENTIPPEPNNPYTSDTQELIWDKNGIFTVNTPKFIAAVGFLQNYPNKEIGNLKMMNGNSFGGFTWISLTDNNLEETTKSLLTIGTKQENTNTVWNSDKSRVLNIGTAPTIIEPTELTFQLTIHADSIRINPLDVKGQASGNKKVYFPANGNQCTISFDQTTNPSLWFGIETVWKNNSSGINDGQLKPECSLSVYSLGNGNPSAKINYEIAQNGIVTIELFDGIGQAIEMLVYDYKSSGHYEFALNTSDLSGGMYFIKMTSGNTMKVAKMVVSK
jgi:hypothetical protein